MSQALTPCVMKKITFTYTICTTSFSLIAKLSDNLPKKQNKSKKKHICTKITKLCLNSQKYQN